MSEFSLLLAAIMVSLIVLSQFWQPKRRAARLALALVLVAISVLFLAQTSFAIFDAPLDPRIERPLSTLLVIVSGVAAFGLAIRTFVLDYRRATAERLAKEKAQA